MKIEKSTITYRYNIDNIDFATVTIYPKKEGGRTIIVEYGSTMVTYNHVQKHPSQALALRYLKRALED